MSSDLEYRFKKTVRNRFKNDFKKQSLKKSNSIFKYTGISYNEYIKHFKNDTLWEYYCNGENIHIDHIIPVSAYDFNNPEEIKKCWNPKNLRLLSAYENVKKSNIFDFDLIKKYDIEHLLPENIKCK